ncbi:hypothetical protein VTK56DRAFT_3616 [Thermocarpiscus australiensis]
MASSSSLINEQRPGKPTPSDAATVIHLDQSPSPPDTANRAKSKSNSIFTDLFAFTPPSHAPLLAFSILTSAAVAAGKTAYAVLLGRIFGVVAAFGAGALSPPEYLAQIVRWAVWMCVLGAGMWVFSTLDVAAWVVGGELRARRAREAVFGVLMGRGVGWFEMRTEGVGGLVSAVQTQTRELQTATSQTLGFFISDLFVFAACMVVAFVFSFKLTLVMMATGVPSVAILWGISRFLGPAIEAQKRELAQAAKHATASTTAIDLVKVYNGEDHEAFQFISAIRRSAKHYSRQALCNCGQMSYIKLWMIMLFVIGFYFAVVLVSRAELTPGDALTTFYAALIAFTSLKLLGRSGLSWQRALWLGRCLGIW